LKLGEQPGFVGVGQAFEDRAERGGVGLNGLRGLFGFLAQTRQRRRLSPPSRRDRGIRGLS